MNILEIKLDNLEKSLDKTPKFSQLCIIVDNIDTYKNAINLLDNLLTKLRINGELIFSFIDLENIFHNFSNNLINSKEVFDLIKTINEPINISNIKEYIVSLSPQILMYKYIKKENTIIVSLKRIDY
jgi:hypothetical protein